MFGKRKILKQIETEKQQLEAIKQELLFIKENLEDTTPKIDISDLYIWNENGLYSIVKLNVENFRGATWGGLGRERNGFKSTLVDIFTNQTIYIKQSLELINSKQWVNRGNSVEDGYYAYLTPIYKFDNNILAYADKKVPLYVLQQLYYKLNDVNINAYVLKKENK